MYKIKFSHPDYGALFTHSAPWLDQQISVKWQQQQINTVISLVETNYFDTAYYTNVNVINYPIEDFSVPSDRSSFKKLITKAVVLLKSGKNISVHCYAGIGRTGIVAACIYGTMENVNGEQALAAVRRVNPDYAQTAHQEQFIFSFLH
ncbi:MAG TPA: dual specificity protein phosphatase family protein [Spirochaetota bacterium]|nr:dual specificity protein phosphatase family protein [Spirochaetota bacterium]